MLKTTHNFDDTGNFDLLRKAAASEFALELCLNSFFK